MKYVLLITTGTNSYVYKDKIFSDEASAKVTKKLIEQKYNLNLIKKEMSVPCDLFYTIYNFVKNFPNVISCNMEIINLNFTIEEIIKIFTSITNIYYDSKCYDNDSKLLERLLTPKPVIKILELNE